MSIDAGDVCEKGSVSEKGSISAEGSDRCLTDRGEREMQRRQEERMPGVPVREWVGRLVARRSAARAGGGLAVRRRGES
ncbi:hypothetical protein [Streptomyces sp. NBC_01483]|uniref:hypothetical protein n=1 Tax=Streptomyces sp. NBC_01483 TaxID=2903883 RepID=UPI002E2FBEEA|nr:hypothetical protein [Streptomyces sp. NBC_01483]